MKKVLALAALLLSMPTFAQNFRGLEWGQSIAEIREIEKNKNLDKTTETHTQGKYSWELDVFTFEDSFKSAGKFDVQYVLLDNKLIQGNYSKKIKKGELRNYKKMRKILEDKYGYPQGVYRSSSFFFDNGTEKSSAEEKLTWNLKDTQIDLVLNKNEMFEINYYTRKKELLNFIRDKGLEKEREQVKRMMKDSEFIKSKI